MQNRETIVMGLMTIISYFLLIALFKDSSIVLSLGGMPLIDCMDKIITDGNSAKLMSNLVIDFAQMIITVFVIEFTMTVIPNIPGRGVWRIFTVVGAYMLVYIFSLWLVRAIIFTDKMNQIIRFFIALITAIISGLGAVNLFGGRFSRNTINNALSSSVLNNTFMGWFGDAFIVSAIILFIIVAVGLTVGIAYFIVLLKYAMPFIGCCVIMLIGFYIMIFPRSISGR